ncbi:MAG: hypothetical protein Q8Q91_00265, partial [Candidatus Daviesbacteria bacterium]|nr:hypothetical protein [Candidatus Daviesbacteria bacterium]
MSKKLTIIISLVVLTLSLSADKAELRSKAVVEKPQTQQITSQKLDKEAQILASYLARFDSPLQYHSQDLMDAARTYGLDWKIIPAIAGVESTFGKHIPGGYNAWGWGVYGNQAIYFNSWREGIFTIAKGLRENYFDKGLTEPYSINRIYAASPHWGWKVTYFMQDLEKFALAESEQKGLT